MAVSAFLPPTLIVLTVLCMICSKKKRQHNQAKKKKKKRPQLFLEDGDDDVTIVSEDPGEVLGTDKVLGRLVRDALRSLEEDGLPPLYREALCSLLDALRQGANGTVGGIPVSDLLEPSYICVEVLSELTVFPVVIGVGAHGSPFLLARLCNKPIAVKTVSLASAAFSGTCHALEVLQTLGYHPNIVGYRGRRGIEEWALVFFELCAGTWKDLASVMRKEPRQEKEGEEKENIEGAISMEYGSSLDFLDNPLTDNDWQYALYISSTDSSSTSHIPTTQHEEDGERLEDYVLTEKEDIPPPSGQNEHPLFPAFLDPATHPHFLSPPAPYNTTKSGLSETIQSLVVGMLKGLEYMHLNGMVHNKIQPETILIALDGTTRLCSFSHTNYGNTRSDVRDAMLSIYTLLTGTLPNDSPCSHCEGGSGFCIRSLIPETLYCLPFVPPLVAHFLAYGLLPLDYVWSVSELLKHALFWQAETRFYLIHLVIQNIDICYRNRMELDKSFKKHSQHLGDLLAPLPRELHLVLRHLDRTKKRPGHGPLRLIRALDTLASLKPSLIPSLAKAVDKWYILIFLDIYEFALHRLQEVSDVHKLLETGKGDSSFFSHNE